MITALLVVMLIAVSFVITVVAVRALLEEQQRQRDISERLIADLELRRVTRQAMLAMVLEARRTSAE